MPRPARRPKRFKQTQKQIHEEEHVVDVPVASTPVHTNQIAPWLTSPGGGLSPIQQKDTFSISKDADVDPDEFGFHVLRGVTRPITTRAESDQEQMPEESSVGEIEEDIYGTAEPCMKPSPSLDNTPSPPRITPSLKSRRNLRTSELLPLLPARRKRRHPPQQQRKMPNIDTSDTDSDAGMPPKSKFVGRKRRPVEDKENVLPVESDREPAEEPDVLERRKAVRAKFVEVDKWEMAFETVDLSFSSQD